MRSVFVLVLFYASVASAQKSDFFKSNSYVSSMISGDISKGSQSSLVESSSTRNTVFETLFGSQDAPYKNDGLSWPPLPRFWGVEGYSQYVEAKFGVGLPSQMSPAVLERMYSFKYEVVTTFHYLGSLKVVNRNSDQAVNELLPEEFEKVFVKDYLTSQEFFRVTKENPIVGMCQYELALYHGKSTSGGVSFFLKGIVEGGRVNFARMSVYSRMFNVKPRGPMDEYSTRWYLNNECSDRFVKFVKPFVDEAFSFKAREFNAYFHPNNTCEPAKPIPNQNDKLCQKWHDSFWSKTKKKNTVGRCEMQYNGESHCVLKSKEGWRCPMYYTDGEDTLEFNLNYLKEGQIPPKRPMSPVDHGPYSLATIGEKEYPCDTGLVCSMDTNTTATCKKIKTGKQQ